MKHQSRTIAAALALLALSLAAAAQADERRWYKVELMVFTHEGASSSERWEPTPALAYPDRYRFLVYPDSVRAQREAHEGPSELDDRGVLTLLPPPQPEEELPATPDIPHVGEPPAAAAPAEPTPAEAEEQAPPRPVPFVALPASAQEFRGKAAYMERTGEYQMLFHEAWVQPMPDEADAVSIVLDRSGDGGNWPRLQGSVKLYVARYLHIDTNLWLNTRGDYLPGNWRMPAPPLAPPSVIEKPAEPIDSGPRDYYSDGAAGWTETPVAMEPNEPEESAAPPSYPWRHAVLLKQERRMRSHEVHYLDHPLFSLIVKMTPLNEEELEQMAAEQPSLGEPPEGEPVGDDQGAASTSATR